MNIFRYMYSADLIQRIFYQKEKGNTAPYEKVYNDLLASHFEHSSIFELNGSSIYWGLFSDSAYKDIISQNEETFYFYLWDDARDFEVIMPARVYTNSGVYSNVRDLPITERKVKFYAEMWVIGRNFPGLEEMTRRPLKLFQTTYWPNKEDRLNRVDQWFTAVFQHYFEDKPLLYEKVDFPQPDKRLLNKSSTN